jgi:CheY-like chemotaxis protein
LDLSLRVRQTTEIDANIVDVLVVDDDVPFAASVVEELEQLGYVAVAAANGAEALRVAQDRPPRLILLDLEMPVMNGWQFLHRRRASRGLSRIPVVVVSAIAATVAGWGRDEVQGILEKPIDEQDLLGTLRRLLPDGSRPASASPAPGASALILVVEDDDDTRDVISELLEDEGYRVASARHGGEAEHHLRSGARPDCILLDLSMPVMDGWTFVSRLQRLSGRPIPVVVITAAEPEWGYPTSVGPVMKKPLSRETLLARLRNLVPGRQSDGGAASGASLATATPGR